VKLERSLELIDDCRKFFQKPKEEKLKEDPTRSIRSWIQMANQIIRTNKRKNKKFHGQRKMMDQYFKWNPPDPRKPRRVMELDQHRKQDLKPD
jgi:hypothetical protein